MNKIKHCRGFAFVFSIECILLFTLVSGFSYHVLHMHLLLQAITNLKFIYISVQVLVVNLFNLKKMKLVYL